MSNGPSNPPPLSRSHRTGSFPSQRRGTADSLRHFREGVRHVSPRGRYNATLVAEPDELDLNSGSSYPIMVGQGYRGRNHGIYEQQVMDPWYYGPEASAYTPSMLRATSRPTTDIYMENSGGSRSRSRRKRYSTDTSLPSRSVPERLVRFAPLARSPDRSYSPPPTRDDHYAYRPGSSSELEDDSSSETEDDDDEGYDENLGGRVFQFVPSRGSGMTTKGANGVDTEDSSTITDDDSATSFAKRSLKIFQSRYTGDAVSDGTHTAKLTVIHDPKKQRQPLFRWMHLEQRVMNFDELSVEVSRIPSITDSERFGFTKLLTEVKRNHVKVRPTSKGNTVRHMDSRPIRVAISPGGRAKDQTDTKSLTWLCIPYFSLEKYSGLLSASTPSSFPVETLLQSEYARTTQEREMQQVVCQNGEAPAGHCFHIAQLWCIVLDNTLLITCGRMPAASLRGDSVEVVTEPLKQPDLKMKTIYVSYYDSVLWAFPLEICLTWFDFLTHFHEFWPQAVKIFHHGRLITGDDWPQIVNLVRYSSTKTTLDLRLGAHPLPPVTGVLKPLGTSPEVTAKVADQTARQEGDSDNEAKLLDISDNKFHVFTWMDLANANTGSGTLDMGALVNQLTDVEEYLLGSTAASDRNAYKECSCSSRQLVHAYLEGKEEAGTEIQEPGQKKDDCEDGVDIFNAADILYEFFLPPGLEESIPTVGKFWGSIQRLVEVAGPDARAEEDSKSRSRQVKQPRSRGILHNNIHQIKSTLRDTTRTVQSFQGILSKAPEDVRNKIEVPDSLIRAWLHLIMALIQATSNGEVWQENMNVAEALIQRGMNEIMDELPAVSLLDYSVVQPMELVGLLSLKLLHDSTGTFSSINDTYSEYLKGLENEIATKDSDRSYQLCLTLFKQEVSVIRGVIASQMRAVVAMSRPPRPNWGDQQSRREKEMLEKERDKSRVDRNWARLNQYQAPTDFFTRGLDDFELVREPDGFSKLSATDPGGFRELFGRECRTWLDLRDDEFYELNNKASQLEIMNTNKIEVTKDRQEAAVYAFTMVTIIFLPLSTISSIFGMNSSDVRDMEAGQWAYWAAALPTTLLVIIAGLWWMGELRGILNWVRGIPSSSSSTSSSSSSLSLSTSSGRWSGKVAGGGYANVLPPPPPPAPGMRYYDLPGGGPAPSRLDGMPPSRPATAYIDVGGPGRLPTRWRY
ncbi:hypothetical protein F5X99DRAFT_412171 [Biscogniauxia marginata]|nr:hypothetical protein F5X99DRAFT_412171 [Biscogniauxia marginata]